MELKIVAENMTALSDGRHRERRRHPGRQGPDAARAVKLHLPSVSRARTHESGGLCFCDRTAHEASCRTFPAAPTQPHRRAPPRATTPRRRYKARTAGAVFAKPEFAALWKLKPDSRRDAGATAAAALRRPAPFGSSTRLKILKLLFERPTTHEDGPGCGFDISSMRAKGFVVRASARPTASDGCVGAGADPSPVAPVALLATVALVVVLRRRVVDPLRATPSPRRSSQVRALPDARADGAARRAQQDLGGLAPQARAFYFRFCVFRFSYQ